LPSPTTTTCTTQDVLLNDQLSLCKDFKLCKEANQGKQLFTLNTFCINPSTVPFLNFLFI